MNHILECFYKLLDISEKSFKDYSKIETNDFPETIYYEYEVDDFNNLLFTIYLLDSNWIKFHKKNMIIDMALKLSEVIEKDIFIAAHDPIDINISDWLLVKSNGKVFRVLEKHLENKSINENFFKYPIEKIELSNMKKNSYSPPSYEFILKIFDS